ncbi:MAG: hypothetical protein IKT93_04035 [Clostridia bacterium]|nr:hypothetical protein [Clostridia bacterium]
MDKKIVEKYKNEMLNMYRVTRTIPTVTETREPVTHQVSEEDNIGELIAIVTSIRNLYPVPNARVTVFTGNIEDKQVIATDVTDRSGRTGAFKLKTPSRQLSQQADRNALPYAVYNMLVEADGFIDNIHLNIPVFSGVTSLQRSDMMLLETAGTDKDAQIFNEGERYDL